jgi:hypothetical protein
VSATLFAVQNLWFTSKFLRVKSQVEIQQMADGDHIFAEIYLLYQPEIQLNFQEVISANQIESSLGIDE